MKEENILSLNENQKLNEPKLNNIHEEQSPNAFCKNKKDCFFPLKFPAIVNENIILEEFKKIMDDSKSEETKSEISEDETSKLYFIKKQNNPKNEIQSTFNSSNNISFFQEKLSKEELFTKKINFKTILHHKRGRKSQGKEKRKKNAKRCHGSSDFDNLQRKIQVNYITFLIKLANDAIKTVLGKNSKYFFKDVKYGLKKIVTHKYVEFLKKCKYSDIIQMNISLKNKKLSKNLNKETYMEICKISPELQKFFDKNYLYIFQKFYCRLKKNQNIIDIDGIKVELSPLTKGFLYLLEKNEPVKEKINKVVNDVYFYGLNYTSKSHIIATNPFIVQTIDKKE